jgi:hypothetical protein
MAKGKKSKNKKSRIRYWDSRRLERKKVCNLVRYNRMEYDEALRFWRKVRKKRVKFRLDTHGD